MVDVENLKSNVGKPYLIKLWNLFFKNGGNEFCDAYLVEIDGNWSIMLNGNGDKILLSKAQLDYLISKMETLDLLQTTKSKLEFNFGLENGSGISKNGKKYKILFQYQTHINGDKQRKPFKFIIKQFGNNFRVDFDKTLLDLHKFRNILEKIDLGSGKIKVEFIYDIEKEKEIYHKETRSRGTNKKKSKKKKKKSEDHFCVKCNSSIAEVVADYSKRQFDKKLCRKCQPN